MQIPLSLHTVHVQDVAINNKVCHDNRVRRGQHPGAGLEQGCFEACSCSQRNPDNQRDRLAFCESRPSCPGHNNLVSSTCFTCWHVCRRPLPVRRHYLHTHGSNRGRHVFVHVRGLRRTHQPLHFSSSDALPSLATAISGCMVSLSSYPPFQQPFHERPVCRFPIIKLRTTARKLQTRGLGINSIPGVFKCAFTHLNATTAYVSGL